MQDERHGRQSKEAPRGRDHHRRGIRADRPDDQQPHDGEYHAGRGPRRHNPIAKTGRPPSLDGLRYVGTLIVQRVEDARLEGADVEEERHRREWKPGVELRLRDVEQLESHAEQSELGDRGQGIFHEGVGV